MKAEVLILKGNIVYSKTQKELEIQENSYLVCQDGRVKGIWRTLPFRMGGYPIRDYGDCLIIPGLVDLHIHAPQYGFRGVGADMELLDWLEIHTFPEEAKYRDLAYAESAYRIFVDQLRRSPVTRACVFGTVHREGTLLLMDLLEKSGICTMTGKVNMDRNCPDSLRENTEESLEETERWLEEVKERHYNHTFPILTPRFTPSCTDELLEGLGELRRKYGLPVQTHLSENLKEEEWVKELCPWSEYYGQTYERFGLSGGDYPSVMAHCIYSSEEEIRHMKENHVFIAHCPESNMNLASGIAPVRRFLDAGMHVGLGSDVAGGSTENPFAAMSHAVQASKLRWRLVDESQKPLTTEEVFYMATKGGGAFFGRTGSFEPDYEFDAVVLDDSRLRSPRNLDVRSRLERMVYLGDEREVKGKFVKGKEISL